MICQVDYYHFYSGRCGPELEARRRGSDQRSGREGKAFPLFPLPHPIFIQQKVLDADVLNAFFVNPRFNVIFDHHNFFE